MKKFFTFIAAVLFAGSMMADEGLVYTLDYHGAQGAGNAYASTYDVTVDGMDWNVPGNATTDPARIGGKSLNGVDRVIYSKTPITNNISRIEIEHGIATDVTVNSLTVIVASDANFTNTISTLNPEFQASTTITVERPEGADWSNAYYKFIYNLTIEASSNKYVQFIEARFIGEGGAPIIVPDTIPATVAQAVTAGMALDSLATSFDVYEVTGFVVYAQEYSLDHKNQIWFMVDDLNAPDSVFEAYGCTISENDVPMQVIDGDKVLLRGKLTKYWSADDNKFLIEIKNCAAEFIEKAEGDHSLPGSTPLDTINVTEAIAIAAALTPEKGKSATTSKTYAVKGFVVGVSGKTENTYFMADTLGAYGEFEAYKCASVDAEVAENDYVIVTGKISHYYGESTTSGEYHSYEISGGTLVHTEAPQGIEEVVMTEKATKVMVDGVMYIVRDNKMYNLQGTQIR